MKGSETIKIIMERRSIRKFEPKPVEDELAMTLLECGFAAPSSKNYKPCQFILINERAMLEKIGAATPAAKMVAGAGLAIAVCVDVPDYEARSGQTDGTWMEDSAVAMENILLAARAVGLEGVWMKVVNRPDKEGTIPQVLGLPQEVKLFAIALVGYPAETRDPHSGIDQERLHKNTWQVK